MAQSFLDETLIREIRKRGYKLAPEENETTTAEIIKLDKMNIKTLNWHKFFFRLTLMLSILSSITVGLIGGIDTMNFLSNNPDSSVGFGSIHIKNPISGFLMTFAISSISIFLLIFVPGRVLYFTIRWIYNGLKSQN